MNYSTQFAPVTPDSLGSASATVSKPGLAVRRKINVLVVDDSAIIRNILSQALSAHPAIGTVSTAPDAGVGRTKILALKPDVLTLDLEMPGMDGLAFLKELMRDHPLPVVVISSLVRDSSEAALEALRLGAVEVLPKPGAHYSVGQFRLDLLAKVRAAAESTPRAPEFTQRDEQPPAPSVNPFTVIALGASTGGVHAIETVLAGLPVDGPGIVIALHIPPVFSAAFANRLNKVCPMHVKEAADGDPVTRGCALVAPGDRHVMLRKASGGYRVQLSSAARVCYQRPSADVLFESVAEAAGPNGIGVLLTGMGTDGALGLLSMKRSGARTIAQDQETCVVFGMPKEAILQGAVDHVLPLSKISSALRVEVRR